MTSVPSAVSASFSARWIWSGPPATGPTARTDACRKTTSPGRTPRARKPSARSDREYTRSELPAHGADDDRRRQRLAVGGRRLDAPHDVEAAHHPSERGEALPVRVPRAAEVERRLVAD